MVIAGARPNFMKVAPLMRALHAAPECQPLLVHTGQHYDPNMSDRFFEELGIPRPDAHLEVGSGTISSVMGKILLAFEPVLQTHRPDVVMVVGDVTSTIACTYAAVQSHIPVAHVEAGLRSGDRGMPEEINRILTDSVSDFLFVSEPSGVENLLREGIAQEKIFLVGNCMIDTLLAHRHRSEESTILEQMGIESRGYALVTLHRPSNVDDPTVFGRIVESISRIAEDLDVIFPVHPRTRERIARFGLADRIGRMARLRLTEPMGYFDFLKLTSHARVVLTDSGGVQEETTILQVPCITLRENTERPVTVTDGTNQLAGTDPDRIADAYQRVVRGEIGRRQAPLGWDGKAAERIVEILRERLGGGSSNR